MDVNSDSVVPESIHWNSDLLFCLLVLLKFTVTHHISSVASAFSINALLRNTVADVSAVPHAFWLLHKSLYSASWFLEIFYFKLFPKPRKKRPQLSGAGWCLRELRNKLTNYFHVSCLKLMNIWIELPLHINHLLKTSPQMNPKTRVQEAIPEDNIHSSFRHTKEMYSCTLAY